LSDSIPAAASTPEELRRARNRVLDLYTGITVLMLLGIAVLIVYAIRLGGLTGPGVEESFGLAAGLMFLMAALIVHTVDRTYREWPLGRRFHPSNPGIITEEAQLRALKILVLVIAAAGIAYILGGLIAG
jgi:Kef-type K+ transport system membrane component KefB